MPSSTLTRDEPKDQYTNWFGHEMRCTDDRQTKFFYAGVSYTLEEALVGGIWMCEIGMWSPDFIAKGFNEDRATSRLQAEDLIRSLVTRVAMVARGLGISGALKEPDPPSSV